MPASIDRRMARRVTRLAKQRTLPDQHGRVAGAVYLVTGRAVFGDRGMLPEEWTAFFSMAGEAVFIDAKLFKRGGALRAMWVMTVAADDLAFTCRVAEGAEGLCSLVLMAGIADIGLGGPLQNLVRFVNLMAVYTGYIIT